MAVCPNHPDCQAKFRCMKYGIDMCEECLRCLDPKAYCKYRSACPIHFMLKRGGAAMARDGDPDAAPRSRQSAA